jgi:putative SOS response-associated peptidase YedK
LTGCTFREANRKRRSIVPVDGFFEWQAIKGVRAKHPCAIAMKTGEPFHIGGIWENWKVPPVRRMDTDLRDHHHRCERVGRGHPRPNAADPCARRLCPVAEREPDPRELMRPFPAEPMRMWPIAIRVNTPENDDPSILDPVELATDVA